MSNWRYTDRNWSPIVGDHARALLELRNDREFFDESVGVRQVPKSRWAVAQDAERHGWMDLWTWQVEDRNLEHFVMFDQYAALRGKRFERAIELGCGPFTNLSFLPAVCELGSCALLDPLIESYVQHPNCAYASGSLRNKQMPHLAPLAVTRRIAAPIEEMPTDERYDLALMINVIEHCFDFDRMIENIGAILSRGSVFCFHDRYLKLDQIKHNLAHVYDAGHPLQVDGTYLDAALDRLCAPVFRRLVVTFPDDIRLYFIGVRR